MPGSLPGFGRGVFGLSSWDPLPRPGQRNAPSATGDANSFSSLHNGVLSRREDNNTQPHSVNSFNTVAQHNRPANTALTSAKPNTAVSASSPAPPAAGSVLVAKYSYSANKNGPIGEELNLKKDDQLRFRSVCPENDMWWLVENIQKQVGFVPAKYVRVPEKVQGLPWLANSPLDDDDDDDPDPTAGYKKYVPTYDLKGEKRGGNKLYCEVCERYFNGSVPYDSHMRSKAHKEEVELAKQYGRL